MPLLTVNNLRASAISIQDPSGMAFVSFTVPGSGAVTDKVLTDEQFSAIEPQLKVMADAAHISFTVKDDPNSGSDSIPLNVVTATATPYTAADGDKYVVTNKAAAGAHSVVLSANAPVGQQVTVVDLKGDAGTNNVTVTVAGGGTINGGANIVISTNRQAAILTKVAATAWVGHRVTV